jgi:hypothetical protein
MITLETMTVEVSNTCQSNRRHFFDAVGFRLTAQDPKCLVCLKMFISNRSVISVRKSSINDTSTFARTIVCLSLAKEWKHAYKNNLSEKTSAALLMSSNDTDPLC